MAERCNLLSVNTTGLSEWTVVPTNPIHLFFSGLCHVGYRNNIFVYSDHQMFYF